MLPLPDICMYNYNLYFLYTIIHLHNKNVDDIIFLCLIDDKWFIFSQLSKNYQLYENDSALPYLPYYAAQFYILSIQKFYRKIQIVVFNTGTSTFIIA